MSSTRNNKIGVIALFAVATGLGCSSSNTATPIDGGFLDVSIPDVSIPDVSIPDVSVPEVAPAAPTFTQVYSDIISGTCAGPCHNPNGIGVSQGHLDMSTQALAFANLVGTPTAGIACAGKGTRVVAGNADGSIMYLKANNTDPAPCGSKMPLGSNGLGAAQSDEIEAWINAGALNN
jgi:hypothetical protein